MPAVQGNLQNLKPSQIRALERIYRRRFPADQAFSAEQAKELALLSRAIGRQIGVLIDRHGKPYMVLAGLSDSIYIPELPHVAPGRMRGLRLLHTHLSPELLSREDMMDLLFLRLDGAFVLSVDPEGNPSQWQAAWLAPPQIPQSVLAINGARQDSGCFLAKPRAWHDMACEHINIAREIEAVFSNSRMEIAASEGCAFLVSVSPEPAQTQELYLDELQALAESAGLTVGGRLIQRMAAPDPRLILGKGKLVELEVLALNARSDLLIFDGELTPAQLHNLADATERKVMDRTQLILDIFAQRATSSAGKLQVELAQLAYMQPRLAGKHKALDRLMGGIGGRGPGESKLETDRRKCRERMTAIRKDLERLKRQRALARRKRENRCIPLASLIGYTNAGKSTLLNTLTSSSVKAENRLFATLDPVTRRLRFPREREITISDTVGFIRSLPRELSEAFRATLEELKAADIFIHVADASHPELASQIAAVRKVLEDLDLLSTPSILVLNKADAIDAQTRESLESAYPTALLVSGLNGSGLDKLLQHLENELFMAKTIIKPDLAND